MANTVNDDALLFAYCPLKDSKSVSLTLVITPTIPLAFVSFVYLPLITGLPEPLCPYLFGPITLPRSQESLFHTPRLQHVEPL